MSFAPFAQTPAHAEVVPPPVEIPGTLTLDQALLIFRSRGLDLLIAEAAVASAEGDERIAGAVPNLGWNAQYGQGLDKCGIAADGTNQGPCQQYSFGLSDNNAIEDSLSGKRGLRLKVAKAALQAAKLARIDAQRVLEFQIKQQYAQVVLAAASLGFAKEVQDSNTKTLDLNKKRYAAGAINEGDLARVETAKLEADQAVDGALQNLRSMRVALAFLLGVRGRVPDFEVDGDSLKYRVPGTLQSQTPDALMKTAFEQRPDLRALGFQRDRAQNSIALAKRLRFPDIGVSAQFTSISSSNNSPQLTFGLQGNLPVFYQQQGEIRKAEADFDTQSLQIAKTTAQVVSDVETGYAAFATSRKLVERMESTLLERARTARDITKRQFEGGTATLIDFLDAQRTFIATNLEYLQDLANYWTAVYQLEQAVGTELRK